MEEEERVQERRRGEEGENRGKLEKVRRWKRGEGDRTVGWDKKGKEVEERRARGR